MEPVDYSLKNYDTITDAPSPFLVLFGMVTLVIGIAAITAGIIF